MGAGHRSGAAWALRGRSRPLPLPRLHTCMPPHIHVTAVHGARCAHRAPVLVGWWAGGPWNAWRRMPANNPMRGLWPLCALSPQALPDRDHLSRVLLTRAFGAQRHPQAVRYVCIYIYILKLCATPPWLLSPEDSPFTQPLTSLHTSFTHTLYTPVTHPLHSRRTL